MIWNSANIWLSFSEIRDNNSKKLTIFLEFWNFNNVTKILWIFWQLLWKPLSRCSHELHQRTATITTRSRADPGVDLVEEDDHSAVGLRDLVLDADEALTEGASEPCGSTYTLLRQKRIQFIFVNVIWDVDRVSTT